MRGGEIQFLSLWCNKHIYYNFCANRALLLYLFYIFIIEIASEYIFDTLHKIMKKKAENLFSSINSDITFLSDYGEEFKFKKVIKYIESLNAKIIQIGVPKISKLGIIERLIRTLQQKLSIYIEDIYNRKQYIKYFKHVVNVYHNTKHSFLNESPNKYLNRNYVSEDPWNMYKFNDDFNYKDNKYSINNKMNEIKKKYKLMQPVRRKINLKHVYKRSHYSNWSDEIFFIDGFKRPLTKNESIGVYLIDRLGKRQKGITYSWNLKKIHVPEYNKVKKVILKMKKRKLIRFSFENFPNSYYRDVKISDLNQFLISKRIRKEITDWLKENGI